MNPLNASDVAEGLGGKFENVCRANDANLNEILQQQIVADNTVRSSASNAPIEAQCLDLQTGKVLADDSLEFQDFNVENPEVSNAKVDAVTNEQIEGAANSCIEDKVSYEIHTRNESLEGDRHPITGVQFNRETVVDADGNEVTGVFPEFDSTFDAQLPEDKLQSSDSDQFAECNGRLKEAVENDPELAKQFTPEQQEQIANGDTPDGYTWHHNEVKGKMQLVDSQIHAQTGHTGGRSIWGGGSENR